MKKVIAFLTAALMLFSFCACGNTEDDIDPDDYIGEGLLTMLAALVDSNQHFYNEVFVLGHLEYDESMTVEKDGKTWAEVTDTTYSSYGDLVSALKATYTDECAEQILADYPIYADIDGKLYFDLSFKEITAKGKAWERNPMGEVENEGRGDDYLILEYRFDCGKSDEIDEFRFTLVDGSGQNSTYRLSELQYVD